jgi:hypothetical protein
MRKEEEKQSEFKKGSVDFCVVVVVAFSCVFFFLFLCFGNHQISLLSRVSFIVRCTGEGVLHLTYILFLFAVQSGKISFFFFFFNSNIKNNNTFFIPTLIKARRDKTTSF